MLASCSAQLLFAKNKNPIPKVISDTNSMWGVLQDDDFECAAFTRKRVHLNGRLPASMKSLEEVDKVSQSFETISGHTLAR